LESHHFDAAIDASDENSSQPAACNGLRITGGDIVGDRIPRFRRFDLIRLDGGQITGRVGFGNGAEVEFSVDIAGAIVGGGIHGQQRAEARPLRIFQQGRSGAEGCLVAELAPVALTRTVPVPPLVGAPPVELAYFRVNLCKPRDGGGKAVLKGDRLASPSKEPALL